MCKIIQKGMDEFRDILDTVSTVTLALCLWIVYMQC